jgi:hypothetical protein
MSKGSNQRPTDKGQFDKNYDQIFGKKDRKENYFDCPRDDMGTPIEDDSFWTESAR